MTGSSGSAAEPRPFRPAFAAHHNSAKAEFEPNTVMVKFKAKATSSARKAAVAKVGAAEESVRSNVVKIKGDLSAPELLKKVKADPTVELASLNYKRYATAVPNDEFYGTDQAAYLNTVRMPQAWDLSKTTGSQIVAVLDTGVDAGHPDLVGHLVTGYNATSPNRGPIDDNGHGTMTLGIIAAAANNVEGVAGVGWNVKAMPVKVLASDGSGYDVDIAEGIDWAVAHGAKVINMSLGGPGDNPILHQAVSDAVNAGVTVVAAAGNDGSGDLQYPASYTEAIAVAATDANGALTDFSSFGDWVDIAAPGWDILSTGPRSLTPAGYLPYWYCTGTSCSAPIVAGVAALVKNKYPSLGPYDIAQRLEALSRDAGPRGIDPYYGHGILDAYAALGGRFAPDFPTAVADGNDQPIRAKKLSGFGSTTGAIDSEGDVDWYSVDLGTPQDVRAVVTGPSFDERSYSSNVGPVVDVYDSDLKFLGHAENEFPVVDPVTGPKWGPLTVVGRRQGPRRHPVRCRAQLQRLEGHPAVHAERGEQRRRRCRDGSGVPAAGRVPGEPGVGCAGVREADGDVRAGHGPGLREQRQRVDAARREDRSADQRDHDVRRRDADGHDHAAAAAPRQPPVQDRGHGTWWRRTARRRSGSGRSSVRPTWRRRR